MLRVRPWLVVAIAAGAIGLYLVMSHLASRIDSPPEDHPTARRTHLPRGPRTRTSRQKEAGREDEAATHAPTLVRIDLDGWVEIAGRVLTPDGMPLAGAEVACVTQGGTDRRTTNEEGSFIFGDRPDEFVLCADHPEHARTTYGPFSLEADQALRDIEIRMADGGFISGTVTDEHGALIEGAHLDFHFRAEVEDGVHELIAEVLEPATYCVSDAAGNYTSPPLRAGTYTVIANHDHYLPGAERTAHVKTLETTGGIDLVMKDGVTISGWVLDWDGNGFPRVEVEAFAVDKKVRYAQYGGREAVTDDDGAFVLRGLEPGAHNLIVSLYAHFLYRTACSAPAEGIEIKVPAPPRIKGRVVDKLPGQPVERFRVGVTYGLSWDRFGPEEHPDGRFELVCDAGECWVQVYFAPGYAPALLKGLRPIDGAEPEEILVELVRGATLTFHVTSAEDGSAVAEASVSWEAGWAENPTDADGKCVAVNVPPGQHEFEFDHFDFALKHVVVEVTDQESERDVNVVLDKGLTIRGRVVTKAEGGPVPKALVMLAYPDLLSMMYGEGCAFKSNPSLFELHTWTDERGLFKIENVTLEEYALYVWHEGYVPFKKVTRFSEDSEEELLVEMTAGGRIVGTVTTADGAPITEAEVRELVCGDVSSYWTDAQGKYVVPAVEPGLRQLEIRTPRATVTRNVLVREGEDTRLDVVLDGAAIFGKVTRAGKPVKGLEVHAMACPTSFARPEGVSASAKTDEEGRYRIEGLLPGYYGVGVTELVCLCQSDVWREVHVGNQDLHLDFEFEGNAVTGVVRMPNGEPASRTAVSLQPSADDADRLAGLLRAYHTDAHKAWTDNQGVFRIEGVTPGPYHLVVAKEGYAIQVVPVEKREGEDAAPPVTLARDATVVATVRLPEDETAEYLQLTVGDEEGRLIREDEFVRIDPQTRQCHIYGLAPGRYTVVAWADVSPFPCHQDIVVRQAGTTEVELLFKKGSQLGVIVIDDRGAPLSDSEVVLDPGGRASLAVKLARASPTDGDGSATFQHIPDGEYTVRVRCEGYEDVALPVRIAGRDEEVTTVLKPKTGEDQ